MSKSPCLKTSSSMSSLSARAAAISRSSGGAGVSECGAANTDHQRDALLLAPWTASDMMKQYRGVVLCGTVVEVSERAIGSGSTVATCSAMEVASR
jgi:hypothetical protein